MCLTLEQRDAQEVMSSVRAEEPWETVYGAQSLAAVYHDVASLTAAFKPDFQPISVGRLDPARSGEGDQRPDVAGIFNRVIAQPRKGT